MDNVIRLFPQDTTDDTQVMEPVSDSEATEEEAIERPSLVRSARNLLMLVGAALVIGALVARSILMMNYALTPSIALGIFGATSAAVYVAWRYIRNL